MATKILITGGNGNLAKEFVKNNTNYEVLTYSKEELDITNASMMEEVIEAEHPDIFLHCAALTRPMSIHEENPVGSIRVNVEGTINSLIPCIKRDIKFVYISTDYVYPGIIGNYDEDSPLLPVNNYAWSKLGGECVVHMYRNSLILRMSIVEDPFPHPKALIDSRKSPVYIGDAAKIIWDLIDQFGIINVGGDSSTIYEFARRSNPSIGKISLSEIKDVEMALDSTMNIDKMMNILKQKEK